MRLSDLLVRVFRRTRLCGYVWVLVHVSVEVYPRVAFKCMLFTYYKRRRLEDRQKEKEGKISLENKPSI